MKHCSVVLGIKPSLGNRHPAKSHISAMAEKARCEVPQCSVLIPSGGGATQTEGARSYSP